VADVSDNQTTVPPPRAGDALFLDFDGTLLHLQEYPAAVRADAQLLALLRACASWLEGALAIVSGRPLAFVDDCLAPERFAAAGLHGLERRDFSGNTRTENVDSTRLRRVAGHLAAAMEGMPMTLLEDKGASLALHWRRAPAFAPAVRELAARALHELGPRYRLLEGDCVVEMVPLAASKGHAVRAFMQEAPFRGRRPVFVGDDITDLEGIAAARAAGGHGIAVGSRIRGDFRLADARAVRDWLAGAGDA
jgi:trehalose 6-phosphate phosphatase